MGNELGESVVGEPDEDASSGSSPISSLRLVMSDKDNEKAPYYLRQIKERMSALFDDVEVMDAYIARPRARRMFTPGARGRGAPAEQHPEPFKMVPSEFLKRARTMVPQNPAPTASAFASWVYGLYGVPGTNEEDIQRGIEGEKLLYRFGEDSRFDSRRGWIGATPSKLASRGDGWRLVHQGLHLTEEPLANFEVDTLRVNGTPMRLSPDLVYRNQLSGEVRIVEIKLSRLPIPANLWPNVWAQLWCYSHIPLALNAPKVVVAGEVWGDWMSRISRDRYLVRFMGLRSVVRRDPRAPSYDRFFLKLFNIYGGQRLDRAP